MVPNSIVQFVGIPKSCAMACTSRYSEDDSFPRHIIFLTESTSISAPPPGIDPRPDFDSAWSVCLTVMPDRPAMWIISIAVSDLR